VGEKRYSCRVSYGIYGAKVPVKSSRHDCRVLFVDLLVPSTRGGTAAAARISEQDPERLRMPTWPAVQVNYPPGC